MVANCPDLSVFRLGLCSVDGLDLGFCIRPRRAPISFGPIRVPVLVLVAMQRLADPADRVERLHLIYCYRTVDGVCEAANRVKCLTNMSDIWKLSAGNWQINRKLVRIGMQ